MAGERPDTRWEVQIEKYFPEVSKMAQGCRPRAIFVIERKYFSTQTDQKSK